MRYEPTTTRINDCGRAGNGYASRSVRSRWAWTEPTVLNGAYLTPRNRGQKEVVWFKLIDKVFCQTGHTSAASWAKSSQCRGAARQ